MTTDRIEQMELDRPYRLLKRAGQAAFWFFLLKGLAWLAAPLVFYFWL